MTRTQQRAQTPYTAARSSVRAEVRAEVERAVAPLRCEHCTDGGVWHGDPRGDDAIETRCRACNGTGYRAPPRRPLTDIERDGPDARDLASPVRTVSVHDPRPTEPQE